MLELINEMPATAVGVKATGKISKSDYQQTLWPALQELYKNKGRVSLMLIVDTPLKNYSAGAWMADARTGLKYFSKWRRVAIVSGSKGIRRFTNVFGKLAPGQYKGFHVEDLENARKWVGE